MLNITFIQILYNKSEVFRKKKETLLAELKKRIIDLEQKPGDILKLSKKSINHCVNERTKEAQKDLKDAEELIKKYDKQIKALKKEISVKINNTELQFKDLANLKLDQLENNLMSAKEEFLEAKILFDFIKNANIYQPRTKSLQEFNSYVGGLSDFCGELVTKLRTDSINQTISSATFNDYISLIKNIYIELSKYSFTNPSGNRAKINQLKSYIKEAQKMQYEKKYEEDKISKQRLAT